MKDVMTTIDRVFMLDSNTRLTFETMLEIYKNGYTRIPVYDGSKSNIIGILYTKDLILIDPDDEVEIKAVLAFHGFGHVRFVADHTRLHEILSLFKHNCSHLMVAMANEGEPESGKHLKPRNGRGPLFVDVTATGVITLEDVIEEIIDDEIVDESDQYRDNTQRYRLSNRSDRSDGAGFLKLFGHKLRKHNRLSREENAAVCAFLKAMMPEFADFAESPLTALVQKSEVVEIDLPDGAARSINFDALTLPTTAETQGYEERIVYRQGTANETFSLILQGHLAIQAGTEKFSSNLGPWSVLGS